jgi:Ser/Thr protein kinase RdoA (MazF antagonist)
VSVRSLETTYSSLVWSDDGTTVAKSRPGGVLDRRRFRGELRVNQLLLATPPPVPAPKLLGHDVHHRRLQFEALSGEPLGPKYPRSLQLDDIDAMVALARRLRSYQPRTRWLRRLRVERRLHLAAATGRIRPEEAAALLDIARRCQRRLSFAHGDLTARNVMLTSDGLALIDWEWAGLYPAGYDLAFLWFSLVDVDGGRERVEQQVELDKAFLLNALLIQLWHLQASIPAEFRAKHLSTRDELLGRLLGATSS